MGTLEEELLRRLLDKVEDSHGMITTMDKKMDLHIQATATEFQAIKALDEQQNAILEEHHLRSDRLEQDNKLREAALRKDLSQMDKRVESLELPKKWFALTKKWLLYIAAVAGAIMAIIQAITALSGK